MPGLQQGMHPRRGGQRLASRLAAVNLAEQGGQGQPALCGQGLQGQPKRQLEGDRGLVAGEGERTLFQMLAHGQGFWPACGPMSLKP